MNFQDSVFLISGIAYIGLILLPGQQTKKTFSMAIESVLWFLAALIMVANAFIQNNLLQVFTGIMYSFNCMVKGCEIEVPKFVGLVCIDDHYNNFFL